MFLRLSFIFLFFGVNVFSQGFSTLGKTGGLQGMLKKSTTLPSQLTEPPILDAPVDTNEYIIGPGDLFSVIIDAQIEDEQQIMVNPEGSIVVPAVGHIYVAGLSLAKAKKAMLKKIEEKYSASPVTIALIQLRSFRVTVSGAVYFPGLVTVNALNRVSDAVLLAGGLKRPVEEVAEEGAIETQEMQHLEIPKRQTLAKDKLNEKFSAPSVPEQLYASKRNIFIRRRDGSSIHVDLERYELAGHADANPYLLDGDVITVPYEEEESGRVRIAGAVRSPNQFEYAPPDIIKNLLAMAHGFRTDADSSKIELVRFSDSLNVVRTVLSLEADKREKTLNTKLLPDDRLFVRAVPKYHRKRNVEIEGEVLYPGMYALAFKPVYLSQILKMAGGVTPEASLENAYIIRKSVGDYEDPEYDRLLSMQTQDMSSLERQYFKFKSRERIGQMIVDFKGLVDGDSTCDVVLQNEDKIIIPSRDLGVKVSGQVTNPGWIPFKKGASVRYYIKAAGGYSWNARRNKMRVIEKASGTWFKPSSWTRVGPGDTIFVPENPETNYWEVARDVVTALAQIASIYLVIDRAMDKSNQ
ncbi:SLBB domain-containing protein [candidate division KSB1 bacterium]|nr:SLBB domain-containing protein [candidate division KSB1 bacterium]